MMQDITQMMHPAVTLRLTHQPVYRSPIIPVVQPSLFVVPS
jgi:hypothetical protein